MYNKYAELRRRYLRTHKSGIYTGMLLTDKLDVKMPKDMKRNKECSRNRFPPARSD